MNVLVLGAGGFIGSHMAETLSRFEPDLENLVGCDLKLPIYKDSACSEFIIGDLRDRRFVDSLFDLHHFDIVYQFAADMGGAGYVFSGNHDLDIMASSSLINLNVVAACLEKNVSKVFYSSSACIYPAHIQESCEALRLEEDFAYPASPDSEYGWEKLFSERLYLAAKRNYGLNIRIARYHNIFGPYGSWNNGKEKAPAAICRKVAEADDGGVVEIWGDGNQTRSFLHIDECIKATRLFVDSGFDGPVNIGSEELISISQLVEVVADIAGKNIIIKTIAGPVGVQGRNSNNDFLEKCISWKPNAPLRQGLEETYAWVQKQLKNGLVDG